MPVLERYGWSSFAIVETSFPPLNIARKATVALWGPLGTAAIVLSLVDVLL